MKQTLNSWKNRRLTLNGKVLILKSLIISQFTHIANLLPISDDVIKEIDQFIFEFLWNGKTHKVKKRIIVQDFNLGGYKMLDLRRMIMIQKLKWVKLYLNGHNCLWRNVMESLITVKNLTFFLLGNFDMTTDWTNSLFYSNVIRTLFELNKHNQLYSKDNILLQRLFYNKYLQFNGNFIFDQTFINAGIWTVSDLFDSANKHITFDKLHKRGICGNKYLFWRNLIMKINKCNPNIMLTTQNDTACKLQLELPDGDRIDVQVSSSKSIYLQLISLDKCTSPAISKYATTFPQLTELTTRNVFVIPRTCTKSNILKDLQFQILHRYIPTNHLLYKMGKISSMTCTFCNIYSETIIHLFYECTFVKGLWMFVEKIIEMIGVHLKIELKNVLFGFGFETKNYLKYNDVNNLLLHVKGYIWNSRRHHEVVSVAGFVSWFCVRKVYDSCLEKFYDCMLLV